MHRITGEIAADVVRSVVDVVDGVDGVDGVDVVDVVDVVDGEHAGEAGVRPPSPPVSIAIVDDAGSLMSFQRMTGAPRFSADFAIAKARTAAAFGTETSRLEDLYADRPVFAHSFVAQGGYFLGRGGVPILVEGAVVGAVGVSGADAHGEESIAGAAVARAVALVEESGT